MNKISRNSREKLEGIISVNTRGKGFVAQKDEETDIVIYPENLDTAMNGDTVEIEILGKKNERGVMITTGRVIKVLERKKTKFVGILEENHKFKGSYLLKPDDIKANLIISIKNVDKEFINKISSGDKVQVEILEWKRERIAEGKIIQIIGKSGENNTEMESIVLEKGFDTSFPISVIKEAESVENNFSKITEEEVAVRKDFRQTFTCTIDPVDAKDFDDALSLKQLDDGNYEIGVHIADVAFYVREGTELDREAKKRAFSVYLVDRTIPMLPHALSNGICSLNPNEDRLAFSAVFKMTPDAKIIDKWFGRTVIHSDKRFSYESAQEVLNTGSGEYFAELETFRTLANIFRKEKINKGAIDFETTEIKFILDENGKPLDVVKKERLDTHKLVEEFMLLANKEVAEFIYTKNKISHKSDLAIYRIHDLPNTDKIAELGIFLRALGFEFNTGKKISPKDVQMLLEQAQGHSAEEAIKTATLRSMSKAIYSTKNVGHFGLAFDYYTHFTSPIRRYPDLIVHRILAKLLSDQQISSAMIQSFQKICTDSSRRELEAADAERTSIKYKQVEFMQDKVGQIFDAKVSGVAEWGMYVEDLNTKAEGLIRLRDLVGDFFELDKKKYAIIGQKTGKTFMIGDKLKIKLMKADLDLKALDFALVE